MKPKMPSRFRALQWFGVAVCALVCSLPITAQASTLIAADYGIGDDRVDVTSRIQSFLRDGYVNFRVDGDSMGGDPAPHRVKELRIHVRDGDGRIRDFIFAEKSTVNLRLDARRDFDDQDGYGRDELVVLQAFYGANSQTIDVTRRLRDMVRDRALLLRITNESLGSDPAPEQRKALFILYRYRGERRAAIVQEKSDLKIP